MIRKNFAWLATRSIGFWLLLLALQMLPGLMTVSDSLFLSCVQSWHSVSWYSLASNHGVATLVHLIIYLVAGFYLIGRGEWVIRVLAGKGAS